MNTPAMIGHEFIGCVEEISEKDSIKYGINSGDHVIVYIACPCGECLLCRSGDDANCVHMGVTNGGNPAIAPHFYGGYGEYNYSPVSNLIKIPDQLDPKMTCAFACAGPTAFHAFELARRANCGIEKANVAVVQGLGPVGLFAVTYLSSLGIKNIVAITARSNLKKKEAAKKLGATEVFSLVETSPEAIMEYVLKISDGLGADVVFEASGNTNAIVQGMDLLRNRGTYLIPGQYSDSGKIEISPQLITFKALQIIGSSQYSISDIESYLDFLQKNPQLHSDILSLAGEYTVEQINKAIEDAKSGGNIKTILVN